MPLSNSMRFVISAYGVLYVPFLAVCLRSVRLYGGAPATVLYDDIPQNVIGALQRANPAAVFVPVTTAASEKVNPDQRIAAKTEHWGRFLTGSGEVIAFIDADTLVRGSILEVLPKAFDLVFTWKDERYPLNTGVVVVRDIPAVRHFMGVWLAKTRSICDSDAELKRAISESGGGDQQALFELMGRPDLRQVHRIEGGAITFVGVPCSILNETNSVPLNTGAKILHYKGGWHNILLRGDRFTRNRPQRESQAMYDLWHTHLAAEEEELGFRLQPISVRARKVARRLGVPI